MWESPTREMREPPKKFLLSDLPHDELAFSHFAAWSEYTPAVSSPFVRVGLVVGFSVLSLAALSSLPWYMAPVGWVGMTMCFFGLHAISVSCSNNSLAQNVHLNRLFGWLCSLFTLTAYESWNVQRKKLFSARTHTRSIALWLTGGDLWMWTSLVSWLMNSFFPQCMPGRHAQKRVVANVLALYCLLFLAGIFLWRTGVTTWPTLKFYFIPLVLFHIINSAMIRLQINNDPSTVLSAMKAHARQMNLNNLSPCQLRQLLGDANAYLRSHTYPAWVRWINLVFGVDVITTLSEDALAFCSNPLSFMPEFGAPQIPVTNTPLAQLSAADVEAWLISLQLDSVLPDVSKYQHVVDGALLAEVQGPADLEMVSSELLRRKIWKFVQDAIQHGVNMEHVAGHATKLKLDLPIEPADTSTSEEPVPLVASLNNACCGFEKQLNETREELKAKSDELLLLRAQCEQQSQPDQALQACVEALEVGLNRAVQAAEAYREEVQLQRAQLVALERPIEERSHSEASSQEALQVHVEALELGLARAVGTAEAYRQEVQELQVQLASARTALDSKQQECDCISILKCALESCLEKALSTTETYRQEINALRASQESRQFFK